MASIDGSVGQGGDNQPADVSRVQAWLNTRLHGNLVVDGQCGPQTIAAIEAFQLTVRGVITPDGLISPTGPTLLALVPSVTSGPSFPEGATLLVDLSHNNANLPPSTFAALKSAGVGAVILKASQGATFPDPLFASRIAQARNAGLLVGAYHFGTGEPVAPQLANFLGAVTAAKLDFRTVVAALDVEVNPADQATPPAPPATMSLRQADDWVAAFKAQTHATPLVYGGLGYLGAGNGMAGYGNLTECPLWIAAYPSAATIPASLTGWNAWTLWQYTDGTHGCYASPLAGVSCDQSVFRGSPAQLTALWTTLLAAPVAAAAEPGNLTA